MDKRELILQAAVGVFARDGLEKGKISDIAKEAGIGKGTVYEYFSSKSDIFHAIESNLFNQLQTEFAELVELNLSPTEKIETFFKRSLEMMMLMGESILIITELWAHTARWNWHGEDTSYLSNAYENYRQQIKQVLNDGVALGEFREMNADGISALLLATIDGLSWQYMMMKDDRKFKAVQKEAIKSFMRGIQK